MVFALVKGGKWYYAFRMQINVVATRKHGVVWKNHPFRTALPKHRTFMFGARKWIIAVRSDLRERTVQIKRENVGNNVLSDSTRVVDLGR